jgi:NADP-dependent 3-hydroxy acid dehydrogenase YdfG
MKKQQSGHIISTDSVAGHVVYPDSAVYCGTKFAVRAIMEGLRQEERENNIRSTIVSPGAVTTELYTTINDAKSREWVKDLMSKGAEGLSLKPSDIADAVAYAISTPDTVAVSEILIRPLLGAFFNNVSCVIIIVYLCFSKQLREEINTEEKLRSITSDFTIEIDEIN